MAIYTKHLSVLVYVNVKLKLKFDKILWISSSGSAPKKIVSRTERYADTRTYTDMFIKEFKLV